MSGPLARAGILLSLGIAGIAASSSIGDVSWRLGLPSRGVSAAPGAAALPVDTAIWKSYKWRSLGPDRGGRSLTVTRRSRTSERRILRRDRRRAVEDDRRRRRPGRRSPTIRSPAPRSARWRSRSPIRTSSSSAPAKRASAATFGRATASTSRRDGGKTWQHVGFKNSDAIAKIRIHPTNPDIVFVADFGKYGVPSEERGLYKTTDGGKTWRKVLDRGPRHRRGRHLDRPSQSERHLRGNVGGVSQRVYDVEWGSGEWSVQVHRWWRHLDRHHAGAGTPGRPGRQDWRRGLGSRPQSGVHARREREGRLVPVRRRGRHVDPRQRQSKHPPTRLLLHAHYSRSKE